MFESQPKQSSAMYGHAQQVAASVKFAKNGHLAASQASGQADQPSVFESNPSQSSAMAGGPENNADIHDAN